jgi:hypothetical protein
MTGIASKTGTPTRNNEGTEGNCLQYRAASRAAVPPSRQGHGGSNSPPRGAIAPIRPIRPIRIARPEGSPSPDPDERARGRSGEPGEPIAVYLPDPPVTEH